ncbi:MAG: radical SAM protein [Verrucomicrobiia bacterium]
MLVISPPPTTPTETSADGTIKFKHRLLDGLHVEACVLSLDYRTPSRVICISSQAGCPYKCSFCASGYRDFIRNLQAGEIVEQVEAAEELVRSVHDYPFDVTYMGVGEPLANYSEVTASFRLLLDKFRNLHRINVSTIGPKGMIEKLSTLPLCGRLHLQLSLHSAFDDERSRLLRRQLPSVVDSVRALLAFGRAMEDDPCVNYLLFDGINDSREHALALASVLPREGCYIKVSTFCPITESTLVPAPERQRRAFVEELERAGLTVKTFRSRGQDVRAGCGQLLAETE